MRIEKLWVIVRPSPTSEFGDICFETDAKGLALQFKGGLDPEDIHAFYTSRNEAEREAERILAASKKYHAVIREVDR
ncbi:MAG: hypothetical protein HY549_07775 [Elusimicrobia bacterium]|nr:hypothetical protein [Elusimicrobiota bacterium]